jgi:hypothetical protein
VCPFVDGTSTLQYGPIGAILSDFDSKPRDASENAPAALENGKATMPANDASTENAENFPPALHVYALANGEDFV